MNAAPLLRVSGLAVAYGGAPALRGVDLDLQPGEAVALLGANGAGKTTLLNALIGLVAAGAGEIDFAGTRITDWPPERRARLGIGYSPEGRRVFPGMTVRENLEVACRDGREARRRRLDAVHALFPDLAPRAMMAAWRLSGGQQQMLAVGRALMAGQRLLLLDEPSLGLAPRVAAELLRRVRDIVAGGTAVLLAEQNAALAASACDRAYVLELGRVVRSGPARDILADPALRASFLGNPEATP